MFIIELRIASNGAILVLTVNLKLIMKFLAVILMIVSICIIEAIWNDNDRLHPHEVVVTGCEDKRMKLNSQMMEVRCMPRPTLVKLIPQPGDAYLPNYVTVNRCSGYCPVSKSCMPVREKNVTIPVKMYNSNQCFHVLVEEHTRCKCRCSVLGKHCNAHQVYSRNNCACECMNKQTCRAHHMAWDKNLCKCVCNREEEICSSGLEWVPSVCGCAKIVEMPYINIRK